MDKEVVYEQHPVTPERKADLLRKGYKIIDARFAPANYKHPDPIKAEKPGKSSGGGNKPKTDEEKKQAARAAEVESAKAALAAKGFEFPADATLEDLQKLLEEAK